MFQYFIFEIINVKSIWGESKVLSFLKILETIFLLTYYKT